MKTRLLAIVFLALAPCLAWAIDRNTSGQKITLVAYDTTAGTVKTGDAANLTFYVSKDDGAVTALTDTSASEVSSTNDKGSYVCDLTQGETDAVKLRFSGKSTTSGVEIIAQTIYTLPAGHSTLTVANNAVNANVSQLARTIWVAASGGSASGPGTYAAPYNTFANAQTAANPGDTIHLKAGTYAAITISKRLTVVGDSAATTIISDATTPPVLITSHGVTLQDLQVIDPSKQYTGISASDQYFLTIERCIIDAGFDGVYNSGSVGSRFVGNFISSTYDTVSLIGSIGYTVEGNYIVTDGSYATNIPARAIHAENGSSGLIQNNTILIARTNAATAESIGVETGYTPGSYSSTCLIENNAISVSSTNASATGKCYGIKAKAANTTDRLMATVRGGSISVTNAGATANDEIDIDASVAGSSVFVQGVSYSTAKCLGTAAIQELPWSTTPGRSLDITSTGAAGVDWANVENPTTSLNLAGTTVSTSQQVASVSGAVGSVTGAVGSVTGNVGGNVAGSVGSVSSATSIATALLATTNGSDTVATQLQAAGTGGGTSPPDTRDLEPVQFTWTFNKRADGTLESTNTLTIAPGEKYRCGFNCDRTNVLPAGVVLRSMTTPTVTNAACTATKLGVDPTNAKVEVTAEDDAADGTRGYVRTTVINSNGAGPVTLLGRFAIVAEPE